MSDEGSRLEMAELILQEKELQAKLAVLEQRLAEPERRLDKARDLLLKAKAAYEQMLETVKPLRSDKILLEGELEQIDDEKRRVRMQSRRMEVGGVRAGTAELLDQLNELAGDPDERRLNAEAAELEADADLAALKDELDWD